MKLRKLSCMLVTALLLTSMSINAKADELDKTGTGTESSSIAVNEETSNTMLVPKVVLESNKDILENRLGSISIELEDIEGLQDKGNVKFSITKVADVIDGEYKMVEVFNGLGLDLNAIETSAQLEEAANKIASEKLNKVIENEKELVTDYKGVGSVDNLEVGVYLVFPKDTAKYEKVSPFLVSIPYWVEADKQMSYDIKAIPKHSPYPTIETPNVPDTSYNNKAILYGAIGGGLIALAITLRVSSRKKQIAKR